MLGEAGLRRATEMAIVNANYMSAALASEFRTYYSGETGRVGHEMILDLTNFKKDYNIDCGDIAHRLMDYGFHAPTLSFPVHETLMVEPTESEPKAEMDRFIEALVCDQARMRSGRRTARQRGGQCAPHGRGDRRRVAASLHPSAGGLPARMGAPSEVLPLCFEDRRRLRRPQPLLQELRINRESRDY